MEENKGAKHAGENDWDNVLRVRGANHRGTDMGVVCALKGQWRIQNETYRHLAVDVLRLTRRRV